MEGDAQRVMVSGVERGIMAEVAPIFALVIHELTTNAAKYGALSVPTGQVVVSLREAEDGVTLHWVELGGPEVRNTNTRGFGTNLIEQAVPYELGGKTTLSFNPTGLTAVLQIPDAVLTDMEAVGPAPTNTALARGTPEPVRVPAKGTVLVVEDNYMIAVDMMTNLKAIGFDDAELAASQDQAQRVLDARDVALAVLDINLGRVGTSIELAHQLEANGTPFFFISGYGESAPLPDDMTHKLKLQKPISIGELEGAIATVLVDTVGAPPPPGRAA
jgi:hypothetical protein